MELDIINTRVLVHSFILLTLGLIYTSILEFSSKECQVNSIYISSISSVWYVVNSIIILLWYRCGGDTNINRSIINYSGTSKYVIQIIALILHHLLCLGSIRSIVDVSKLECEINVNVFFILSLTSFILVSVIYISLFLLLVNSFAVALVAYLGLFMICMLLFRFVIALITLVELIIDTYSDIANNYNLNDIFSFRYNS